MADSHYRKHLIEQAIKRLMINTQSNLIDKLNGDELFKMRTFIKFFTNWKYAMMEIQNEGLRVQQIRNKLDFNKKLILMKKWKGIVLFSQLRKAQLLTAVHIHKKRQTATRVQIEEN
jgi:hypothetical protein